MPGNAGTGSQLVMRAREAAMRAKTAEQLGISPSPNRSAFSPGAGLTVPGPVAGSAAPIAPGQPPQPASTDVPLQDRARGEVESFLAGLGPDGRKRSSAALAPGAF